MDKKLHRHEVTINSRRRDQKKSTDMLGKDASKQDLGVVFNTVYKEQVRALYREVTRRK